LGVWREQGQRVRESFASPSIRSASVESALIPGGCTDARYSEADQDQCHRFGDIFNCVHLEAGCRCTELKLKRKREGISRINCGVKTGNRELRNSATGKGQAVAGTK